MARDKCGRERDSTGNKPDFVKEMGTIYLDEGPMALYQTLLTWKKVRDFSCNMWWLCICDKYY